MERDEAARLAAEAEEIATRIGDLRSLALLKMLTSARPGVAQPTARMDRRGRGGEPAGRRIGRPRPAGRDPRRRRLRVDLRRRLRPARRSRRRDPRAGRRTTPTSAPGSSIGCPLAWALMGEGIVRRERDRARGGRAAAGRGAADRRGARRPGDRELDPRQRRRCCWRCGASSRRAWRSAGATAS